VSLGGPTDRRQFLTAAGGGLFLCTLGGQKVSLDKQADVEGLSSQIPVPPKVAAAQAQPDYGSRTVLAASSGQREYWIRAEEVKWNIVPTGRDEMMGKKVKGKKKFTAYAYRAYSANFAEPLGPATIPGPLIEANVGETIIVHFQNMLKSPVTIHPHGVQYSADMDGAYKGKYTDPGGFVQKKAIVDYVWEAIPESKGAWMYHDHGPMDPLPLYKGLFGSILIRDPSEKQADQDLFVAFHSFQPVATGIDKAFYCINGRAFAGNTPTFHGKVGQDIAWHVYTLDDNFHTFHIHGHRWVDDNGGKVIDNVTTGPGDIITARYIEDNPGRWFYHCHVFSHLHEGMNGWYIVD
jgi:FtsP/CotA-like multicopper oxidase with cupredoxin domain